MSITDEKNTHINRVYAVGVLENEFVYSHKILGEKFLEGTLKTMRLSGAVDYIPLLISERLLYKYKDQNFTDCVIEIAGQVRTRNIFDEKQKSHLLMYVFVQGITVINSGELSDANAVYLKGIICKSPIYRVTPFGREISDVFLAVNRENKKTSYIPCIIWGRNAEYISHFGAGTLLEIKGRFQSREYIKRYSDATEDAETKITYEISVNVINVINDSE